MELLLEREQSTATSTPGKLHLVDKQGGKSLLCFTLEDVVRPAGVKVAKQTAIPPGRYQVVLSMSRRFQKVLPELLAVLMFSGVRLHGGNDHEDTEGCPLLGMTRLGPDRIARCALAVERVMALLQHAIDAGERCYITVKAAPVSAKPTSAKTTTA